MLLGLRGQEREGEPAYLVHMDGGKERRAQAADTEVARTFDRLEKFRQGRADR